MQVIGDMTTAELRFPTLPARAGRRSVTAAEILILNVIRFCSSLNMSFDRFHV